jgi:PAS domain S-box-containing protein
MFDVDQVSRPVLALAVRDAPVGIGVCDEDGRVRAVNTSLTRLLGRPADQILGHPFLNFIHPDQRPAALAAYFEAVVAAAAGIRHGDSRLRCVTGDGRVIPLRASWTVIDPGEDGIQYGVVYLTVETSDDAPASPTVCTGHLPRRPRNVRGWGPPASERTVPTGQRPDLRPLPAGTCEIGCCRSADGQG